jgi:REP element-mobilizing transposase RayT
MNRAAENDGPAPTKPAIQENGAPGKSSPSNGFLRWHSRGYLPHFESSHATQHVTFHLADSLPKSALQRLEDETKNVPREKRDAERQKRIQAWVDGGHGSCVLAKPHIAKVVQETLLNFDTQRYRLLAWVVMPNHLHVLFEPFPLWTVAKTVASWKRFTARKILDERRENGEAAIAAVWQREYWDRYIRNQAHFIQTIQYIHMNPVKAALATSPELWPWSSASSVNRTP